MKTIHKGVSYVFHPLIMPLLGVVFFFSKTPRFVPIHFIKAKLFSITILTLILPILLYLLLKTLRQVETIELPSAKQRILPLFLNALIGYTILEKIVPYHEIPELYFYFAGILGSTIACLILALLNFKASIHMIGVSGFFMFALALSIHYKININGTLALLSIIIGAVATSRLHLKAHTPIELVIGFFVGLMPQLILLNYWL